jgi:predicted ATP-dependent Lon-type protease
MKARSMKAEKITSSRTVSGLLKLLHPHSQWTCEKLRGYIKLALEGRSVKEQRTKRLFHEFHITAVFMRVRPNSPDARTSLWHPAQ